MERVTQSNAANAEESASASEELSAQAEELSSMVAELEGLIHGQRRQSTAPISNDATHDRPRLRREKPHANTFSTNSQWAQEDQKITAF